MLILGLSMSITSLSVQAYCKLLFSVIYLFLLANTKEAFSKILKRVEHNLKKKENGKESQKSPG